MFGPYELEYGGVQYVGNVNLNEFHRFRRGDQQYLFVVERMASFKISDEISDVIDQVCGSFGKLLPKSLIEELRPFGLLPEMPAAVSDNAAAPEESAATPMDLGVFNIALFVAQECNMNCVYCYGEGGQYAGQGFMSEETAFTAVDWLMVNSKGTEKLNISFFGGEPLLNFPLIQKTVEYSKRRASEYGKTITYSMTTNGSLLTDEIIIFLRDEKFDVLISFDGPPSIQNSQRPFSDGSPSYPVVYANIQKLLASMPGVQARATVYGDADSFEIGEGLAQAGFMEYTLIKAAPVLLQGGETEGHEKSPFNPSSEKIVSFYDKEWDGFLHAVKTRSVAGIFKTVGSLLIPLISGEKKYYNCGVGKGMAGITVSGDIYPCHRFAGVEVMKMGNIDGYKVEGMNDYYRCPVVNMPRCLPCWARYLCGGGCFYENMSRTGDYRIPDETSCAETRAIFEKGISVLTGLDEGDKEYLGKLYAEKMKKIMP